ncbi:glial fibrillary acidic protein-like isoform X1 [Hemitrygon akajei]|uniref:glial fibrillary acidic protein-like isoform X1 n=1 Tax=Hemitrygon akajei TaxID=2704970 RepID=UPI003BFA38EE
MHQSCQRAVVSYPDRTGEQLEKELHDGLEEGKERFKDLNDRFAKYINSTVLCLMRRNKELLAELSIAEKDEPGRSEAIFQKARNDLKCRLEEQQKELSCLKADKEKYKKRLEKEIQLRKEAEKDYEDLRKKTDETNVAVDKLQRKVKFMEIQLSQLEDIRDQERIYWQKKVEHIQSLEQGDTHKADLEQALKEIHAEHEQLAKRNKENMDKYKQKFEEASTRALENAKKELECYRKEMNELKLKDELMKNSLLEKDKDIFRQRECSKVLEKRIVRHTNEYQELLNVKTQLEQEIVTYKNLLGQVERKARDYSSQPTISKKEEARDMNDTCVISSSDEDKESEENEDLCALDQD